MDPYERLAAASGFQWDKGNRDKNLDKHGVTNSEAEQVFFNEPMVVVDERHSGDEPRYCALGATNARRPLFVVFTLRRGKIRVISARDMSKKERKAFLRGWSRE